MAYQAHLPWVILYFVLAGVLDLIIIYYGYITTKSDPSDPIVRQDRYHKLTKTYFPEKDYEYYCNFCEAHVQEKTKHCGRCNRCTAKFDHHCVWLNNCVGWTNYRAFFKLITFAIIFLVQNWAASLFVVLVIMPGAWDSSYYILNIIELVINVPMTIGVCMLLYYHIWLWRHGKTTYQHIV